MNKLAMLPACLLLCGFQWIDTSPEAVAQATDINIKQIVAVEEYLPAHPSREWIKGFCAFHIIERAGWHDRYGIKGAPEGGGISFMLPHRQQQIDCQNYTSKRISHEN